MKTRTVSKLLPSDARDALVKAAAIGNTESDPLRRQKAIEGAIRRIRFTYPQHFHHKEPQS